MNDRLALILGWIVIIGMIILCIVLTLGIIHNTNPDDTIHCCGKTFYTGN